MRRIATAIAASALALAALAAPAVPPARAQDSTAVATPPAATPDAAPEPAAAAPAGGTAAGGASMFSNLANPAIGLNGLFSGQAAPTIPRPYGLRFDEAELSLVSAVDPYWMMSANLVFTQDGVEPEEVWARTTSLPALQLKVGRLRGTFGKHGLLHPHAFPFVEAPIVMANTIGAEGFKDTGLEASWLTPLPWFAELTGGVYAARSLNADNPLDLGSSAHDNLPLLGHLKNLVDVNEATTLELGQSILSGRGADDARHTAWGADVTLRNVPLRASNRHGWTLQGEYLQRGASSGGTWVRQADGGYASLQYRLSQVWWAGVRGERARRSTADFMVDAAGDPAFGVVTRGAVNLAWAPSEFSFVRLEYSHAAADAGVHPSDDRILLQLSYTIGYHPAHAY